MREIKFRAWCNGDSFNRKGMYTGFSFDNIYSGYDEAATNCEDGKCIQEPKWDNLILMQYTGLKDKNGKEIYESDVLEYTECDEGGEWNNHKVVAWENGEYYVYSWGDKHCYFKSLYNFYEEIGAKVIGNIYENKELLK
jgi:uncharacterized phage protein (TIGR01671 family)